MVVTAESHPLFTESGTTYTNCPAIRGLKLNKFTTALVVRHKTGGEHVLDVNIDTIQSPCL